MSRGLGPDEGLEVQNLQMSSGNFVRVRDPKGSEAPRRRPGNGRRSGERKEGEKVENRHARVPKPGNACYRSEKMVQTNVFIDSYYPKLQGELSEDFDSSGMSQKECRAKFGGLKLGDSSESSSKIRNNSTKNYRLRRKPPGDGLFRGTKIQNIDLGTFYPSCSRSLMTLDTRTYTVVSRMSGLESWKERETAAGERQSLSEDRGEQMKEDEIKKLLGGMDAALVVDWFTHLNKRIETLEEFLQQSLGSPNMWESPHLVEDNLDTDHELRNIKERVRSLETKLKQTKIPETLYSQTCFRETSTSGSSSAPNDYRKGGCQCEKIANPSETGPRSSFFCWDELSAFSPRDPRAQDKGFKTEVVEKKKSKVKSTFLTKCQRIKSICSSVLNSSSKSSRSTKPLKIPRKITHQHSREPRDAKQTFPLSPLHSPTTQKTSTLAHDMQQETERVPQTPQRKRKRKKRKRLCRKISMTNFALGQSGKQESSSSSSLDVSAARGAEESPKVWGPKPEDSCLECARWKNKESECQVKKPKTWKKGGLKNPISVLKRGGPIKVPVLFKEVCKTSQYLPHKSSSISVSLVLIEDDSKHPWRKMIKKLSRAPPPGMKEPCLFGVKKCSCDDETPERMWDMKELRD